MAERALVDARRFDHFNTTGYALAQVTRLHMLRADWLALRRVAGDLAALSAQHQSKSWELVATTIVNLLDARDGERDAPSAAIRHGIDALKALNWHYWVAWLLLMEAEICAERRQPGEATRRLDEAEALIDAGEHRFCEPEVHRLR